MRDLRSFKFYPKHDKLLPQTNCQSAPPTGCVTNTENKTTTCIASPGPVYDTVPQENVEPMKGKHLPVNGDRQTVRLGVSRTY